MTFICTSDHLHPYSCDGPGNCVHCDREYRLEENWKHEEREHDPATCALCDPDYDKQPNPYWKELPVPRRRPVPFEWREANHRLSTTTRAWGHGFRRASRTRGRCSCGAAWPGPGANNLTAPDVRDRWMDHVEDAYYEGATSADH